MNVLRALQVLLTIMVFILKEGRKIKPASLCASLSYSKAGFVYGNVSSYYLQPSGRGKICEWICCAI